ncbi:MAG TPA: hypothetical protein VLJ59_12235 [Mycobacteriales bacterium]|nr:hypothetical protein [Mycobacteriales bacterium]
MSGWEGMSPEELLALVDVQAETIASLTLRVAELERQLAVDSASSSKPPSKSSVPSSPGSLTTTAARTECTPRYRRSSAH